MTLINETYMSGTQHAPLEVALPASKGPWPAVLLLHGSFGLLPPYGADMAAFAQALADAGTAAAMPHYFEATVPKTDPGATAMALIPERRGAWRLACCDALVHLSQDPRFDVDRLGVLGFSLGGNLALSIALDPPPKTSLSCVVDFFGPTAGLATSWSSLPPVLVCHGTADQVVDPSESDNLIEALERDGKKSGTGYEYETFPGEGHGFKEPALRRSRDLTVAFFKKHL